ncbi:ABC transporter ATP-binding protein [Microbacterium sp. NPDC076911]|uniref:ABC transporter ATP-binding protein n=1 Tax=Microbacterium sp. NPDC076911 TaxID=3154958 RepID=UPI003414DDEF
MDQPAVELTSITKTYPGVIANADVSISVAAHTVHAIVGENGAGKSTLMKVLYGATQPDSGTLRVAGELKNFGSPADAIAAGIGMVFQHFKLAENISALENIILGAEPLRRGVVDRAAARAKILEICDTYGLAIDPDAMVRDLGVGVRQRIELIKVLYRGARILILDEPTALLTVQEAEDLLRRLREMCANGLTVIFISHHLDEVLASSDHVTVMRSGRVVADVVPGDVAATELAVLMVGSAPLELPRRPSQADRAIALEIRDAHGIAENGVRLRGIDLHVGRGEIVGVAGVEGNGQDELIEAVLGVMPLSSGQVLIDGNDMVGVSALDRRAGGLGCIPQDRQREGLLTDQPLWLSRLLGHTHDPALSRRGHVRVRNVRAAAQHVVDTSDVRTPSINVLASALSGGNQQKFIVGRELDANPTVLIAAQPTRGVDIGAQRQIWSRLIDAAESGMAVLLVSTDMDELTTLSDRIAVISRGRITAQFDPDTATRAAIGQSMTAGSE